MAKSYKDREIPLPKREFNIPSVMTPPGAPIPRDRAQPIIAGPEQIAPKALQSNHFSTGAVLTDAIGLNAVTASTIVNKTETDAITTTSMSYVEIVDLTSTITAPVDTLLLVLFRSNVNNNTDGLSTDTQIQVDSTNYYESRFTSSTANTTGNNSNMLLISVAAGTHTVKVFWKATGGTSTMHTRQLIALQIKR